MRKTSPRIVLETPLARVQQKNAAMVSNLSRQKSDLLLLASLFLLELSIAVVPMAIYMKGERSFAAFLPSRPGILFLLAFVTIFVSGAVIAYQFLAYKRSASGHFPLIVTMNLVTVILMVITGEIAHQSSLS